MLKLLHVTFYLAGIYLISVLGTSMMSLVVTVWVLQMYHADQKTPVPDWIRLLVQCMGAATCQQNTLQKFRKTIESSHTTSDQNKSTIIQDGHPMVIGNKLVEHNLNKEIVDHELNEKVFILNEILLELRKLNRSTYNASNVNLISWRMASDIIDYFFAIFFLTIVVIVNMAMFIVMPNESLFSSL